MKLIEELNKSNVLRYATEHEIFERFIGFPVRIGDMINSPLRKDHTPSFNLYVNKHNNRLWYKDYNHSSGDCFRLVEHLHNCNFKSALKIINAEMNLGLDSIYTERPKKVKQEVYAPKEPKILKITRQDFTYADLEYWNKYYLDIRFLNFFRVFSAEFCWSSTKIIIDWKYKYDNPVFAYYVNKHFQFYRPYAEKGKKFLSNLPEHTIFGYEQLPKTHRRLIITKSMKDIMVFRRLGLAACAPTGESVLFSSHFMKKMKERFDDIVLFYDNDEAGIKGAIARAEEHDLSYVHTPIGEPKDPSDFIEENGVDASLDLLNELNIL